METKFLLAKILLICLVSVFHVDLDAKCYRLERDSRFRTRCPNGDFEFHHRKSCYKWNMKALCLKFSECSSISAVVKVSCYNRINDFSLLSLVPYFQKGRMDCFFSNEIISVIEDPEAILLSSTCCCKF